jgi:hypothetical protein
VFGFGLVLTRLFFGDVRKERERREGGERGERREREVARDECSVLKHFGNKQKCSALVWC